MLVRKLEPTETRDRLIEAALAHVPFDGWSDRAVAAEAADIGLDPAEAKRAFPGGPLELVRYHSALADRRMAEAVAELDLDALKVREKIAAAVRIRLGAAAPHKEAVRAAFSLLAAPTSAPVALAALYDTVDAIWFSTGDKSTDFNFYTKRMLLAGVYLSTLLYWLNDGSEDDADTWAFLDRRISDVLQIQRLKGRFGRPPAGVNELLRQLRRAMAAGKPRWEDWRAGRPPHPGDDQSAPDDDKAGTSGASSKA